MSLVRHSTHTMVHWYQLVNVGSELTVGLGTEKYNVGILTATTVKVGSGVTLSSDGDAFVTGVSTATKFVGDLSNGSSHLDGI